MDNIRGVRDNEEPGGGKFNPFRILEIGESMVRYCDGVRIKNYNFLAILTSDRLVLMESAQQSAGTIAKEIPVAMIQGAVMERDEKNRPSIAISMEVGGQSRLMKLVFTGLIDEPETECREWFTAINGYPPEPEEKPEPQIVPEPVLTPVPEPVIQSSEVPTPLAVKKPDSIIEAEVISPEPVLPPVSTPVPVPIPVPEPVEPVSPVISPPTVTVASDKVRTPVVPPVTVPREPVTPQAEKRKTSVPVSPSDDESVQICIEKPGITPIRMERKILAPVGTSGGKTRFCMHCGGRIPGTARFCPVCGKTQV